MPRHQNWLTFSSRSLGLAARLLELVAGTARQTGRMGGGEGKWGGLDASVSGDMMIDE